MILNSAKLESCFDNSMENDLFKSEEQHSFQYEQHAVCDPSCVVPCRVVLDLSATFSTVDLTIWGGLKSQN